MTRKRDLKKRIRDRQAKTGETYTTARRHVLAAREPGDEADLDEEGEANDLEPTNPGIVKAGIAKVHIENAAAQPTRFAAELAAHADAPETDVPETDAPETDAPETAELRKLVESRRSIEVDEVIDVTDAAKAVGLACKVLIYPRLVKAVDTTIVLEAIKTALAATKNETTTTLLRAVVAGRADRLRVGSWHAVPRDPEFMEKIAAGLTAVSKDGRMMALHVNGYAGMVTIVCAAWRKTNTLMITTPEDRLGPVLAGFAAGESLFLVYEGRRYKIGRGPFVIGRHPTCNLQIRDGNVSRKHVAIVQRHGTYYILDLGSLAGVEYKGMKISNKRVDEGDMFKIRDYALRFTFHETDA